MHKIKEIDISTTFDYKKLLNDMTTFVAVLDIEGNIIFVNNTPLDLSGINLENIKGTKFYDCKWWNYSEETMISIRKDIELCAKGESLIHEVQLAKENGDLIWIEFSIHPILSESGGVEYLIPEGRDINDKKIEEEKTKSLLIKLENKKKKLDEMLKLEKFEVFFEHSIDGILIIKDQKFVDCNKKIIEMLKLDTKLELFNTHPSVLSPQKQPDGRESFEKAEEMMGLACKNNGHQFEWVHKRFDGEDFWVEVTLVPMKYNNEDIIQCVWRDISNRKKMEEDLFFSQKELERRANFDYLTNIPNRRLFDDRLEQTLMLSQRNNTKFALLFLDVDKFKGINDDYGHEIGDKYLIEFVKKISSEMRVTDTLARLGGDEFAIIMEDIENPVSILRLVKNIFNAFENKITINEHKLKLLTSIGISIYPDDSKNIETLLKFSDISMYESKNNGGNTFSFYSEEMNKKLLEDNVIKKDLIKAIEKEEFIIYYQPQIDVSTNKLLGMEALVRWKHPEQGLLFPDSFIPIAEKTGLIIALDRCVMKKAMTEFALWYKQGYNPGILSLNLAMKQIESSDCILEIESIIKSTGFNKKWLELEITESDLMINPEKTIRTLNEIKKIGIKLSIDDFGSGYSSLSYLKEFPIDKLKIDQSFVKSLDIKNDDRIIVNSIIGLANSLKLEVIGEGVETDIQKNILLLSGCVQMQGYLFSKPLPHKDIDMIVKNGFSF